MSDIRNMSVLVTGASGQLGRRAVECLLDAGVGRVVAGTRTPEKVADLQRRGAQVVHLDFDDAASMSQALHGVNRVVMVSTDVQAPAGRRVAQHRALIDAAAKAGVQHLVYTSFARAEADSPISLSADHHLTEQALEQSGVPFTALRNSIYAESLVRRVAGLVEAGESLGLAGLCGIAYVSRDDCARTAAAVALSDTPPRGPVELTGPEVLTDAQWTAIAAEVTGKPIRFEALESDALLERLVASGMPKPRAEWKVGFDSAVASGWLSFATTHVHDLTGRRARSVREVLETALKQPVTA